jgi:hypothetical protein
MHDVAVSRVISQIIGYYFAECFRIKSFVDIFDRVVDIFLGGGYTTLIVTLIAHQMLLSYVCAKIINIALQ